MKPIDKFAKLLIGQADMSDYLSSGLATCERCPEQLECPAEDSVRSCPQRILEALSGPGALRIEDGPHVGKSIREGLKATLMDAWGSAFVFRGKLAIMNTLVASGVISGEIDEEGEVFNIDWDEANRVVLEIIEGL